MYRLLFLKNDKIGNRNSWLACDDTLTRGIRIRRYEKTESWFGKNQKTIVYLKVILVSRTSSVPSFTEIPYTLHSGQYYVAAWDLPTLLDGG